MYRLETSQTRLASSIALATVFVVVLTTAAPAGACLLANRLRVVATHLTEEEIQLYAHGNMEPVKIPYSLAAATPCVGGQADIFTCENVDLLDHLNLSEIGGGNGNDLWGWTDPVTGAEIAIIGRTNGTAFVDVSDPANSVYLGNLPSHSGTSSWRDIKTFADHAFIVADGQPHGIQVFDLTQLRGVTNPPVTFSATAHFDGIGNSHNIVINEATGFAYAVGSNACSGGLYMVDINTPTQPTFAGCFSADGYTHDAQCVIYTGPDAQHTGKEICFASNEDTLTIVDVTNKSNPIQLSRVDYTQPGDSHYAHQGWLTEDQQYFVFDDEFDETGQGHNTRTYVWDVTNLDAPSLTGFSDADGSSVDHNQYIKGNFTFQANYARGLRILELTDLANANLTEVAFFDTYPDSDGNSFTGAWSTYPFFDSGIVIVSDINRGLFILEPTLGCDNDADCDDGLFCNGAETCDTGSNSCQAGTPPCSGGETCVESSDTCSVCLHDVDFEGGAGGWTQGADTCTTGSFVVGVPDATAWQVGGGNPGNAFFTQPNPGGIGTDDVDGGTCEALSPVIAAGGQAEVEISLDYYHGQRDPGDDANDGFTIEVLDGGTVVDTMVTIGDVTNNAAWTTLSTTVTNPGNLQLRVRATDAAGPGDIVEGGIDNVSVCPTGPPPSCQSDGDCDDGLFCNGAETCNLLSGACEAGTAPNCDDGVSCTDDSCNEGTDSCDNTPNDGLCDNGLFCDGSETCSASLGCQAGAAPNCDDGVACTNDSCNEGSDQCDNVPDNGLCDNGLFCDGAETCNAALGCQDGPDPCAAGLCDEAGDLCNECAVNADCDDGLFCNGAETCSAGACQAGSDPCPGQSCDEAGDQCTTGGACSHDVDFESGAGGWTQGADSCSTGSFIVGTPDATTWQVGAGNPGQAFFTANNPGGIGTDDVDGGTCEALSPVVDCAGQPAAEVSLDYFHGQRDNADDSNDGFTIEVLNNGAVVDTIVNIGDVTTNPAWTNVSTVVVNPGNVQVRVRATDAPAGGDIVEGGIDNVSISATTAPVPCSVEEDFESGSGGWTNDGSSTCSTGAFVTATPTEQVNGGVTTQVGGDHTSGSGNAFFSATNTSAGSNDVDGGTCVVTSPVYAVSEASDVSVWYFHGQRDAGDDSGDFFSLEISTDGGANWSTMASFGDVTVNAAWTEATASVAAGSDVQFRVQVADGPAGGDLVEAGVDDVSICPTP